MLPRARCGSLEFYCYFWPSSAARSRLRLGHARETSLGINHRRRVQGQMIRNRREVDSGCDELTKIVRFRDPEGQTEFEAKSDELGN